MDDKTICSETWKDGVLKSVEFNIPLSEEHQKRLDDLIVDHIERVDPAPSPTINKEELEELKSKLKANNE